MAEVDLTAIAKTIRENWPGNHFTRDGSLFTAPPVREGGATEALIEFTLAAAAPIIARQVRERVAREIEAYAAHLDGLTITEQRAAAAGLRQAQRAAVLHAAYIARGGEG